QSRLQPELWDPVTGKQRPLNDWRLTTEANPRTQLPYRFGPHESVFIVFREPAQKAKTGMDQAHYEDVQPITGPWKLHFDPQWH
ncbi:MAG TPA: hypothetical protein VJ960_04915, partial [Oceanipulchritudo sp.]|nr:hypothetical protein [Oceanipulchritudo sp.]